LEHFLFIITVSVVATVSDLVPVAFLVEKQDLSLLAFSIVALLGILRSQKNFITS
jgi:hypothetical protein